MRPFSTGNDAAAAVLATALYQEIPPAFDQAQGLPGEGRKLLLFSDSRQAASFFASYLETSFDTIRRRSLVLSALPTSIAGEAGPAFVRSLMDMGQEEARAIVVDLVDNFVAEHAPADADGQVRRAAGSSRISWTSIIRPR